MPIASERLTIAEFARAGGVGVETIRYYQRRALLRRPSGEGIHHYDPGDLARLQFIRGAKAAGFSLDEIAELIELDATDDRPRAHALAIERIAALDAQIASLTASRDALLGLARECGGGRPGPCPILRAFAGSCDPSAPPPRAARRR